ncbi:MAG: proline dehydrogenase family protein [Candidatus Marinimicrobia bacterium]|nr:proline dehydrogenase family protein [Candidatus Neomarinimicrobiota bacterium]
MLRGFNRSLAALLPYLPKPLVGLFARRYVAGETVEEALRAAGELNAGGFQATLDILGEQVASREEAFLVAGAYAHLYHQIAGANLRANISLKPTHLGLNLGRGICEENLLTVLEAARATGNFLRIDMEGSPYTGDTLDLYRTCREQYPEVGPALQAYLHRSRDDLTQLLSPALNVRICKGIYREPPDRAIQDREAINESFLGLVRQAFDGGAYVAIATHDLTLINRILALIRELQIPTPRFEFQTLHGVPMGGQREALLREGFRVRVYLPFGEAWHEYSLRRLRENPDIVGYVLGNLWRK